MTDQPAKRQFQVRTFADVGAYEEFVLAVLDLIDVLNATMIFGRHTEVSGRIGTIAAGVSGPREG